MNLQPLYDGKERLEAAAIAGTGLLSEDFRLARAAEGLAPLAAASPVFAKIKAGLDALLAAKKEEQPGRLLSLLALVDAVAYTQGSAGAAGELEPLPAGGGKALPLSYGQLHPLLEALTGSGGGRMGIINDCWKEHPDHFEDYRVLPLLVRALGDSYAEIAELAGQILLAQGKTALPLLKDGFDPAGKKEMARRARLVSEIGGAGENDFYLANLPAAKKPVRGELIYALRHCPANGELLQNLAGTERGEHKEMAEWALARTDAPEGTAYLETLAQKDPDRMLDLLLEQDTPTADRLLGRLFGETLDALAARDAAGKVFTGSDLARLEHLRNALRGKTGPGALAIYRRIAALGDVLDKECLHEVNGRARRDMMEFYCYGATNRPEARRPFSKAMPITLMHSIKLTSDAGLCALAPELAKQYGGPWQAPALCAALLTQPSAKAYEQAEAMLPTARLRIFGGKTQAAAQRGILQDVMFGLDWSDRDGCYEYSILRTDPVTHLNQPAHLPLAGPLDPRWFERLADAGKLDRTLAWLLPPNDLPTCQKYGRYLYEKTMAGQDEIGIYELIPLLIKCEWKEWAGLLEAYLKPRGQYNFYLVMRALAQMPITDAERAAELRRIDKHARVLGSKSSWPALAVERQLDLWEK